MKNNLEYYQHYANSDQHPKFKALRMKYGWQGEGRFWALNNRIAQSDNCVLDLSVDRNRTALAMDLGLSIMKFEEFVSYLCSDVCSLVTHVGDNRYTTEIVQENLIAVSATREAGRVRQDSLRRKRLGEIESNAIFNGSNAVTEQKNTVTTTVTEQQSKVKESKVKESKEKETKVNPSAEEVEKEVQNFRDLEQYLLQTWGREGRVGRIILDELLDLGKKHGKEKLYDAVLIAAKANAKSFRYVKAVLENNKPKQGTAPRQTNNQTDLRQKFIAFFCECDNYSVELKREDLERNIDKAITCKNPLCKKQYPVKTILEKAGESGRAYFVKEVVA